MYFRPPYGKGNGLPSAGESGSEVEELEDGPEDFYPILLMNLEVRWAFLQKVYSILAIQMLLMVVVAWHVMYVPPVANFFVSTPVGSGLYIFSLILPFIVLCALYFYHRYHPFNLLLLGVFTVAMSFAVGLTCAFTKGEILLESVILTSVVVVSLSMYTFWAAKRSHFYFQFLYFQAALIILGVYVLIQRYYPLGRSSLVVYGALASLIYCVYLTHDADILIEKYTHGEYVWATVALNVVDIINLFLSLGTLFRASDSRRGPMFRASDSGVNTLFHASGSGVGPSSRFISSGAGLQFQASDSDTN